MQWVGENIGVIYFRDGTVLLVDMPHLLSIIVVVLNAAIILI